MVFSDFLFKDPWFFLIFLGIDWIPKPTRSTLKAPRAQREPKGRRRGDLGRGGGEAFGEELCEMD